MVQLNLYILIESELIKILDLFGEIPIHKLISFGQVKDNNHYLHLSLSKTIKLFRKCYLKENCLINRHSKPIILTATTSTNLIELIHKRSKITSINNIILKQKTHLKSLNRAIEIITTSIINLFKSSMKYSILLIHISKTLYQ